MKRLKPLALLLALALLLSLFSACSSTKYQMSEQHEKYGRKALEIVDAYLDFEITIEEADARLNSLRGASDTLPKDTEAESTGNKLVVGEVNNLYFAINLLKLNGRTSSDILELRNRLAGTLGVSAR